MVDERRSEGDSFMAILQSQRRILWAIIDEREQQDKKWGGADHDDQHEPDDFADFICEHARRVGISDVGEYTQARKQMIRVAALAVAAIESIDRKSA